MHAACVRASLLEADILADRGEHERAIARFSGWRSRTPTSCPKPSAAVSFLPCPRSNRRARRLSFEADETLRWTSITLTLADIKRESRGRTEAIRFITEWLRQRASVRGLDRLLDFEIEDRRDSDGMGEHFEILKGLTAELLFERPVYKCRHCGFPAKSLHCSARAASTGPRSGPSRASKGNDFEKDSISVESRLPAM